MLPQVPMVVGVFFLSPPCAICIISTFVSSCFCYLMPSQCSHHISYCENIHQAKMQKGSKVH